MIYLVVYLSTFVSHLQSDFSDTLLWVRGARVWLLAKRVTYVSILQHKGLAWYRLQQIIDVEVPMPEWPRLWPKTLTPAFARHLVPVRCFPILELSVNHPLMPLYISWIIQDHFFRWRDDKVPPRSAQFVTDALYTAPMDALVKVALSVDIPTYQYVLNTSVEALRLPRWRETPHGLPYFLWTGAPFMDPGEFLSVLHGPRWVFLRTWMELTNLWLRLVQWRGISPFGYWKCVLLCASGASI